MNARTILLEVFSLMGIAVSQPIFDILSKNVDFFAAWNMSGFEIFLVILSIYIALPLVVGSLLLGAYKIKQPLGRSVRGALIITLVSITFARVFKQLGLQESTLIIFMSAASALILTTVYWKIAFARKFVAYLGSVSIVFPLLLFISLHTHKYFSLVPHAQQSENSRLEDIPVILIILDELPLVTLLNKSGLLDKERFPYISGFSKESVWYVKAASASTGTTESVPAILSGILKENNSTPNFNNYPNNLFVLLSGTHHLSVIESVTSLCPNSLCLKDDISLAKRLIGIAYDIALVYSHLVIPGDMANKLPSISYKLNDFGGFVHDGSSAEELDWDGRYSKHLSFIQNINGYMGKKPPFFYYHNLLPHYPWYYLPSGKRYLIPDGLPGLSKERWTTDDWLVIQGYQRHILQSMFVDKMFGEIIEAIKKRGIFDKSLIILTADHGLSFWPGTYRRVTSEQYRSLKSDTASVDHVRVPLFVKYPNSSHVGVSNREVTALDIMPTVADLLDIEINSEIDGTSMLAHIEDVKDSMNIDSDLVDSPSLHRKIKLFGEGDAGLIYRAGDSASLIGRRVSGDEEASKLKGGVIINDVELLRAVDPNSTIMPSRITGRVIIEGFDRAAIDLAVAINDAICGVTRTYVESGTVLFNALVSESCFSSGENEIKIFEISERSNQVLLAFSDEGVGGVYGKYENDRIILKNRHVLQKSKLNGSLDVFSYDEETRFLRIAGWGADLGRGRPVKSVLYRIDDAVYPISSSSVKRPDVAKGFGKPELINSGFEFSVPVRQLSGREFDVIIVNDENEFDILSADKHVENMTEKELDMFGQSANKAEFGAYEGGAIKLRTGLVFKKSRMDGSVDVFSYDESKDSLHVVGWAADLKDGKPARYVFYRIGKSVYPVSSFPLKRMDVAEGFNNKELVNSGFDFYIPVKRLSGREFNIIAVNDDGEFGELSTLKFSEKMTDKELKMFGLYRNFNNDRSKGFLSRFFREKVPGEGADLIGSYGPQGVTLKGGKILAESEPFQGHVDVFSFDTKSNMVAVVGWAANTEAGQPAEYVLYRVDNKVFYGSPVSLSRPDVAKAYNKPSLDVTGFGFSIPSSLISENSVVEVIPVMSNGSCKRISTDKFTATFHAIKR